jgi:hypothetical protein
MHHGHTIGLDLPSRTSPSRSSKPGKPYKASFRSFGLSVHSSRHDDRC